jgi:predicted acylesterase/phospholipase RssA
MDCDIVMKGGVTSGVIYPKAITQFATKYRMRGVGGSSAGAIGAAFAAAAELGRHVPGAGFERLDTIPDHLGGRALGKLFVPQPATRALRPILIAAAANGSTVPLKILKIVGSFIRAFPFFSILGVAPGLALILVGIALQDNAWIVASGALLTILIWVAVMLVRAGWKLTHAIPKNFFGICTGMGGDNANPALTQWLALQLDLLAGLPGDKKPLTFGDLWGKDSAAENGRDVDRRIIDLRMISTCLSRSQPFEMPFDAGNFFYEESEWKKLFPGRVIDALSAASPGTPPTVPSAYKEWNQENDDAADFGLKRLPQGRDLPVIVAMRMSLSFPLLISAMPLWQLDYTVLASKTEAKGTSAFQRLWFTDGGLCSNFPITMFDSPLARRPVFGLNLGKSVLKTPTGTMFELSDGNMMLPSSYTDIAGRGSKAVTGFAAAALSTARNWTDNSYLNLPGFRDRIVKILQTSTEGGLNLNMDAETIDGLAERGRLAADALMRQFNDPHFYRKGRESTGWENHRWVRYRALLTSLPEFLTAYSIGLANLKVPVSNPPSYVMSVQGRALAKAMTNALSAVGDELYYATPSASTNLQAAPRPRTRLTRVPRT